MAGTWLPQAQGPFLVWYQNWVNKLTSTYAATFSLSLGDTASLAADLAALGYILTLSGIFKDKLQNVNEYKRNLIYGPGPIGAFPGNPTLAVPPTAVLADIIARIDAMVLRLKAHTAYTTAIGEDLGIEPPAAALPTNQLVITAKALPNGQGEVGYKLEGSDGAYIEGQDDDGPWIALGKDRHSPYIDTRPPAVPGKSQVRRYRALPLDGDDAYGVWSNIAQISTIP